MRSIRLDQIVVTGRTGSPASSSGPRPTAYDLWPICHNREASEALVPVERFRARLRASGIADGSITDSVLQGYRRGRFRSPAVGAMGYMLSRYAWTRDPETGAQGFIDPHLHICARRDERAHRGGYRKASRSAHASRT